MILSWDKVAPSNSITLCLWLGYFVYWGWRELVVCIRLTRKVVSLGRVGMWVGGSVCSLENQCSLWGLVDFYFVSFIFICLWCNFVCVGTKEMLQLSILGYKTYPEIQLFSAVHLHSSRTITFIKCIVSLITVWMLSLYNSLTFFIHFELA